MLQSTKNLKLSVIIPTYNRSKLLDFTLHSITLQNISRESFEVIVVDDGSSDNTKEIVYSYEEVINIKYFFKKDRGYCPGSSRNIGIMNSSSPICLFVDSGLLLSNKFLSSHLSYYNSENLHEISVLGLVYGIYHKPMDEEVILKLIDCMNPTTSIQEIKRRNISPDVRENYFQNHKYNISNLPAPWVMFMSGNVSVSRSNLIKVGMFDENFDGNWGCEDQELGYRLNRLGIRLEISKDAESLHYPHEIDVNENRKQGYHNCVYFNSKYNTEETRLFLNHYKEMTMVESIDINKILLEKKKVTSRA
ncbi:glycosyltransferase [Maribacter flavus]|uniref:Glycosyltransferase n=1 Tax=Maribacter flavus TaxID=1658664 RepID=A0A5B2TPN8_9FLAO|nr:glycosyltransferase [Maribacter flavus]KAA2215808.1 glycosyltransferase [Maribacter flavus]